MKDILKVIEFVKNNRLGVTADKGLIITDREGMKIIADLEGCKVK